MQKFSVVVLGLAILFISCMGCSRLSEKEASRLIADKIYHEATANFKRECPNRRHYSAPMSKQLKLSRNFKTLEKYGVIKRTDKTRTSESYHPNVCDQIVIELTPEGRSLYKGRGITGSSKKVLYVNSMKFLTKITRFVSIAGISYEGAKAIVVFKYQREPTKAGLAFNETYQVGNDILEKKAYFRKYTDGWRLESVR